MIRLHKNAAVLRTRDEATLVELEASEAARVFLGPRLGSTAAWIDHRRVDRLRDYLSGAGYCPRRVEDTPAPRGADAEDSPGRNAP